MATCCLDSEEELEFRQQDVVRKKRVKPKIQKEKKTEVETFLRKFQLSHQNDLKKFEVPHEVFKNGIPKMKDGCYDRDAIKSAILKHLRLDEDELPDDLLEKLEYAVSFTSNQLKNPEDNFTNKISFGLGKELEIFSLLKENYSTSYAVKHFLKPSKNNLEISSKFLPQLNKLEKEQLVALAKVMNVKFPYTEELSKMRDKISAFCLVNHVSVENAMAMMKEANQKLEDEKIAVMKFGVKMMNKEIWTHTDLGNPFENILDGYFGKPWQNLKQFQISELQFSEMVGRREDGRFHFDDMKAELLNFLKINESDLPSAGLVRSSFWGTLFELEIRLNDKDWLHSILAAHKELELSLSLQKFAMANPRSSETSKALSDVTEDDLKRALKRLHRYELRQLSSSIGMKLPKGLSKDVKRDKIFKFATVNQELMNDTMRIAWYLEDLENLISDDFALSIELFEKNLDTLSTDKCFSIGEKYLGAELLPSLMKKPAKLKERLLNEAKSDTKALRKMAKESQKIIYNNFAMLEELKDLDTNALFEVKKALGMSVAYKVTKPMLKKQIVNHANNKGFNFEKLQNIIDGLENQSDQDMEVDDQSSPIKPTPTPTYSPTKMETDEVIASALDVSQAMNQSVPQPVFTKDQLFKSLDTLHFDQVKRIAFSIKMKASERTLKRPGVLKAQIKKVIDENETLLPLFKQKCEEFIERNSHYDAMANNFSHMELHEISKFLKIELDAHQNKSVLSKKIKDYLIIQDISIPELIQKMDERTVNAAKMMTYLKTLSRSSLAHLKEELGIPAKGNRTIEELSSQIMKIAEEKNLCIRDIQLIIMRDERDRFIANQN